MRKAVIVLIVSVIFFSFLIPASAATCVHTWGPTYSEASHPHPYFHQCSKCLVVEYTGGYATKAHGTGAWGSGTCPSCGSHSFVGRSCTTSGSCVCGATAGPLGHNWYAVYSDASHPHQMYNYCSRGCVSYISPAQYATKAHGTGAWGSGTCPSCGDHSWLSEYYSSTHPHEEFHQCRLCYEVESTGSFKTPSWGKLIWSDTHPHTGTQICTAIASCSVTKSTPYNGQYPNCTDCTPDDGWGYWGYFFEDTSINYISSNFGPRKSGEHYGFDISESGILGTSVHSVTSGKVKIITLNTDGSGYSISTETNTLDPYGSGNLLWTTYMHFQNRPAKNEETNWAVNNIVNQGDQLGKVGSTGNSTGPHLHFQINKNGSRYHNNSYDNVINPIFAFPNIKFTGDTTIFEHSMHSFEPINTIYPEWFYELEIRIVDYVGEDVVLDWIKNSDEVRTINDFREDFNIDDETFAVLCHENDLTWFYDIDIILADRTIAAK